MALGFEKDHDNVRQALLEANAARILTFAAASNDGNIRRVAFPASMIRNVICAFSSDGNVKESREYNPAPMTSNHNFCFLGEEVEVLGSGSSGMIRQSGTSVATSIAAGIAALVLDFSRQLDCQSQIKNAHLLKTVSGIESIFLRMAEGRTDNGYYCVAPEVLGHTVDCENDDQRRSFICETISRALMR
jgi:subtilisin family serine protease